MAIKSFKTNDSKELTLKILMYLAAIKETDLVPTNIKQVDDPQYLFCYEITVVNQTLKT